ncbi:GpE family phage tail protein [Pantoea ananatis]|nr:GpE family phage tail protein [Pantoea ananatis]UYK95517.1 GpE family phage tail protein [Pantoea ananatis]
MSLEELLDWRHRVMIRSGVTSDE